MATAPVRGRDRAHGTPRLTLPPPAPEDGTHVAIDVSYKYEQVAAASAEVRRRAADALAASTQLAGRHAVELLWDEVAAQEARNAVQDIVDAAERDKREARRRAAEEFEADSSEYVTFGLESANRLPKGSWTYMEVVVLGHKPFRTHVASGDACVWGEGVKLRIAKGPERKAVVSLIGERSDTGDGVTTLLGTRTVSLDDIPLGEGGPIEVVDEVSPPQAAKQEVMDELVIEVIEGQNLPAADRGGTSDPIAMVKFEGAMAQTRSLKKTVNPQWREVFVLPLAPSTSQTRTARIDVFDKNFSFVGSGLGDFLGGVDVPVTVIAGGAAVDQWLELEGEGARGRIHVRMKVKENAVEREILPQIKLLLSRQKEVMVPAERRDDVYVSVVRCEGMAAEAAKQAVLFLDQEMRRLPIREGQVDSEQYAHWEVLLEGSSLSVWLSSERVPHTAYPRVPQKRVGAEGRVPLARIERGVEAEVWVDLGEGGRVLLRMARMAKCTQRMEVVCLVKSARGLAAADRGGTSDPYAEVQVGKSLKKTTKVHGFSAAAATFHDPSQSACLLACLLEWLIDPKTSHAILKRPLPARSCPRPSTLSGTRPSPCRSRAQSRHAKTSQSTYLTTTLWARLTFWGGLVSTPRRSGSACLSRSGSPWKVARRARRSKVI